MKYLICLAMMLSLAACNSEEEKSGNKFPGDEDGVQDVTDYSRCNSAGPMPRTIEGTWSSAGRTNDGLDFKFIWTFNNRRLYLSNTCYARGRQLTARLNVPVDYNVNYIEVLDSANNSVEINEDDFQMTCNIGIEPMAANYAFNGRCLVMTINGYDKKLTLVPEQ